MSHWFRFKQRIARHFSHDGTKRMRRSTLASADAAGISRGAHVTVSDDHAAAIERTNGGDAGLVRAAGQVFAPVGTPGRVCTGCGRTWYPWSKTCPRQACGAATVPE